MAPSHPPPARTTPGQRTSARLPLALLIVFLAIWTGLAIAPSFRQDWLLENLLVFIALPTLAWGYPRLRFSNASYVALFVFLVLHEIGAHYTYAEVPVDAWSERVLGVPLKELLGFERNHYDRAIHFAYGLLVTPACLELIDARAAPRGFWRPLLTLCFVSSHSLFFELVEWAAAIVFGGELGVAYLGTQGDVWDAQKDMLMALLGSALSLALVGRRRRAP